MVGDDGLQPHGIGMPDAGNTADAVVHGQQQITTGSQIFCQHGIHQWRAETIAELEAIGHTVVDLHRPHRPQGADTECRRSGPIGVKIANDDNATLCTDRLGQGAGGLIEL
jgi:hypothetical protein